MLNMRLEKFADLKKNLILDSEFRVRNKDVRINNNNIIPYRKG